MRILGINNNYNTKPSFRGFERTVYKAGKPSLDEYISHRNNTYALRIDINWVSLAKTAFEKFKDVDNVFTTFYACSDGRETQSLTSYLSQVQDVDYPSAITQWMNAQYAYQASMQIASASMNMSLLNYIQ